MKINYAVIGFILLLFLFLETKALSNCVGEEIFADTDCAGDEISKEEAELQEIINQYRGENSLPEIPISKPLSIVANRHLLDLQMNLKYLTHSWSNCVYDIKNQVTWNCVTDAPKRLRVNYEGEGFENLYRNLNGNASPALALEGWKKSPLHNSLILNLGNWNARQWNEIGVSIRGQFAAIWFGTNDADKAIVQYQQPKGLGLTFQDVVKNLTSVVSIQKTSSVLENDKWIGTSKDKNVILEMYGTEKDIAEAALSLKIKLDVRKNLNQRNKNLVLNYLKNIFASSEDSEKWFDLNFTRILQNPQTTQSFIKNGKIIEIKIDKNNFLILNAKPYKKMDSGIKEIN